jgi:catechol 2,3-dioxygenase-like lactoylglutathione lyase family enzyme
MTEKPRFGFAIHYVTDLQAARRFYVEVLGQKVERQHATFVQFERFAIASDESMTGKRETELYWLVDDAERAFREMSGAAEVGVALKEMPFGKVFSLKDPAGNACFLLELARDRPSKAAT